jgi:hypothetical protein
MQKHKCLIAVSITLLLVVFLPVLVFAQSYPPQTQSGGVGIEGKISAPPPTQAPTIVSPANGRVFSALPVTVSGWCPNNLLVKVFKNDVFSGSAMCRNSSYAIDIDLFSASNQLIARVYDALDQAGPDSNKVTVTFHDSVNPGNIENRVFITSNYARKGSNPNELLTWPIIITGGTPPYAISVDWGDGTTNDLYTATSPGQFDIKHKYSQSGTYRALIKATDKNNSTAYLQLVAISNGKANEQAVAGVAASKQTGQTVILWQPAAIAIPLVLTTFWLGKKYEVTRIKRKLQKGEHPFK